MALLPIGSIVQILGGEKRVMIYGRLQQQVETGQIWDYISCLYPEGNQSPDQSYMFNHDQIEQIHFTGYQDMEELSYRQWLEGIKEEMKQEK
ncbi:DUF4176 domain-containing protein [Paenibacillus sp. Leaf72]|uniref:DUF4176 domain-containing protein n=1 Tax=Paenibacillus sp. Leaf72 TaxID=1736234 RepID=UPI000A8F0AA0|nr:DUF4176 domain-containing protein [Paenibacillus sp. Leaf72]